MKETVLDSGPKATPVKKNSVPGHKKGLKDVIYVTCFNYNRNGHYAKNYITPKN